MGHLWGHIYVASAYRDVPASAYFLIWQGVRPGTYRARIAPAQQQLNVRADREQDFAVPANGDSIA